jgi:hypothetical protein
MYTTKFVALAFLGTAAAFNPMMQMSTGRRAAIQGAGAAAIAAPLLRPEGAEAAFPGKMTTNPPAPYITILDHRGCSRYSAEYKGPRANAMEDEQCVKLESKITAVSTDEAAAFLRGVLGSFNA